MKVAGVALTNADRVLYPEQGITKQRLAEYYEAIAPLMLPHVAGRPVVLVRCPQGHGKECFYQKHWSPGAPSALGSVSIREAKGTVRPYSVVKDVGGLVSLVQHGVLEIHVWGSRADDIERPDRIVFDLDPGPGVGWRRVVAAARELRERLGGLGLETWLKTTGGKGLHVVIPMERRSTWDEVSGFARALAYGMARENPRRYIATASKAARKGLIFLDWLRNTRGATAVAAWSTRAKPGAPISVPVEWGEIDQLRSGDQYRVGNVLELISRRSKDPWAGLARARQRLTRSMRESLV